MKYIWIGSVKDPEDLEKMVKKGYSDLSGNNYQLSYIKAIEYASKSNVSIINCLNFSENGKRKTKANKWSRKNEENVDIGFINIPIISQVSKIKNIKYHLKSLINKYKDEDICILIAAMSTPLMSAAKVAKKLRKNNKNKTEIVQIVPDLPQFMNFNNDEKLKNILKKIDYIYMKKYLKFCNKFIFFTEEMSNYLNIKKDYIVIEGISDIDKDYIKSKKTKHQIVYAGAINDTFGIYELIEAFKMINTSTFELLLYGNCKNKSKLLSKIKDVKNIKYMGIVSKDELMKIEKESYFMINPRNSIGEYTKYSFPSKTIDYMISGRPVIMYKLHGIPSEYDDHLIYIVDTGNHVNDIYNCLLKCMNMTEKEIEIIGLDAYNFILNNKSYRVQGEKMIKFIRGR